MPMTAQEKSNTLDEFERLGQMLDEMGVEYTLRSPYYLSFDNANGECVAFPSQTYDDKLVVFHQVKEWHDTAEDVLKACGVMQDG